jgi:hypothetical protein
MADALSERLHAALGDAFRIERAVVHREPIVAQAERERAAL